MNKMQAVAATGKSISGNASTVHQNDHRNIFFRVAQISKYNNGSSLEINFDCINYDSKTSKNWKLDKLKVEKGKFADRSPFASPLIVLLAPLTDGLPAPVSPVLAPGPKLRQIDA